jgi:hypothetical protein
MIVHFLKNVKENKLLKKTKDKRVWVVGSNSLNGQFPAIAAF